MICVGQEDVILGLKRCKRLAKQALLASGLTTDPQFWVAQAEARREMYEQLMAKVEEDGVQPAYEEALRRYRDLNRAPEARSSGQRQALEMFFTILGVQKPAEECATQAVPS
ncbi:MAG: hypothetical protein ACM3RP_11860 [Chitinophagales bacterium]